MLISPLQSLLSRLAFSCSYTGAPVEVAPYERIRHGDLTDQATTESLWVTVGAGEDWVWVSGAIRTDADGVPVTHALEETIQSGRAFSVSADFTHPTLSIDAISVEAYYNGVKVQDLLVVENLTGSTTGQATGVLSGPVDAIRINTSNLTTALTVDNVSLVA